MTPEQIERTIALACDWEESEHGWWSHPTLPCNGGAEPFPPEYTRDLNAMHEAERMLTDDQQLEYVRTILDCPSENLWNLSWDSVFQAMNTPAADRAEAFLRTTGLWT